MKRSIAMILACVLLLSAAACGNSENGTNAGTSDPGAKTESSKDAEKESEPAGENTSEEAGEPAQAAVAWDKAEKFSYTFEGDDRIVLSETEDYILTFPYLLFKDFSVRGSDEKKRCLAPYVELENLRDTPVNVRTCFFIGENLKSEEDLQVEKDILSSGARIPAEDWNGLIGETEECRLGSCTVEIYQYNTETNSNERLDILTFDIYASEKQPAVHIRHGEEAVREAELQYYQKLTDQPVYHTENDLVTLDIVEMGRINMSYTYVATNRSQNMLYVLRDEQIARSGSRIPVAKDGFQAVMPGESWHETVEMWEGGKSSIKVYNVVGQTVVQIGLLCDAYRKEDTEAVFQEVGNIADAKAAASFPALAKIKPIHTVENEAIRLDILGTYFSTDRNWNGNNFEAGYTSGMVVYALTNLSDQTLYFDDYKKTAFGPGEIVYGKDSVSVSEEMKEQNHPINVSAYADEAREERAVEMFVRADYAYDPASGQVGVSNFNAVTNKVNQEAMTGIYYSFYSDAVIAETPYYTLQLQSMSRQQNEAGAWQVRVTVIYTNTSDTKYVPFDPGKQFAGYDPGHDWILPGEEVFYTLEFTGKDENDLTGKFSMDFTGYSWNGVTADKLFEKTESFTLRFDKKNPVVSGK